MKQKEFTMHGTAVDKNGQRHEITVVGLFKQPKMASEIVSKTPIQIGKKTDVVQGECTYKKMVSYRTFRVAYSICNPEDKFDEEYGIKRAMKRIDKNPVYELTSFHFSALNDDMCHMLLLNEIMHISKNIDKYISNDKNK